ncbi:MAG: hypothetical protein ABH836_07090 [Candidatus Omnitrophota bacterium]
MFKKQREKIFRFFILAAFLLFILYVFPLPGSVFHLVLKRKLSTVFPEYNIKFINAEFYLLRGFKADYVMISEAGEAVASFKKLRIEYSPFFVVTNKGRMQACAEEFVVRKIPKEGKVLNFLANVLDDAFIKELVFDNFSLVAGIKERRICVDKFELGSKNLRIYFNGWLEKEREMDFNVNIILSRELIQVMPEEAGKILIISQEDGSGKISFRVYGLPWRPSFKIKTDFLEIDIS